MQLRARNAGQGEVEQGQGQPAARARPYANVVRLDVPMEHAFPLQVIHDAKQFLAKTLEQVQPQPPFLPQPVGQGFLARAGKKQGAQSGNLEALVTLDDVLMAQVGQERGLLLQAVVEFGFERDLQHALLRLAWSGPPDFQGETGSALAQAPQDLKAVETGPGVGLQWRARGRRGHRLFQGLFRFAEGGEEFAGGPEAILGGGPGGELDQFFDLGETAVDVGGEVESRSLFALGGQIVAINGGRLARQYEIGDGAQGEKVELDGVRFGGGTSFRRQVDVLGGAVREHLPMQGTAAGRFGLP